MTEEIMMHAEESMEKALGNLKEGFRGRAHGSCQPHDARQDSR